MKTLLTATFSAGILMTSGCSSDPHPELASNGNYFMVGGASCENTDPFRKQLLSVLMQMGIQLDIAMR